jgi:hypothetical protein
MILENITDVLEYEIRFDLFDVVRFRKNHESHDVHEDLYLDDNTFVIDRKEPAENIISLADKINLILSSDGADIVKKSFHVDTLFSYDGCRYSHKNSRDPSDKTKLSFSFYYGLSVTKDFDNLSSSLNKMLTNITLKFSIHISPKQFKDMFSNPGRSFYFVEIPPIVEERFKTCLTNVYESYLDAVDIIEHSNSFYETYNSLPESVRNLFERYKIQNAK